MRRTMEIPREHWFNYFEGLSRRAQGRSLRVESVSLELGDQPLAGGLPLVEIELEMKGSSAGAIRVTLGQEGAEVTHQIAHPWRVYVEMDEDGGLAGLDIEDAEEGKSLLFFEPGVPAWDVQGAPGVEEAATGP